MSFRCAQCTKAQAPRAKPIRIVTKTRPAEYSGGGVGWENGEEHDFCELCAEKVPDAAAAARAKQLAYVAERRVLER